MTDKNKPRLHAPNPGEDIPGDWHNLKIPSNIKVGVNTLIDSSVIFKQFFSKLPVGLVIGDNVTIRGASLATEENAFIEIGNYSFISNATIACFEKISIGSYVFIAGGVNIVDTDFHPLTPAARMADTIATSPVGIKKLRPAFLSAPVIIEDDVWIGYNATILKGVRIGKGSVIQPGSVVSKNVEPGKIVAGNPAKEISEL